MDITNWKIKKKEIVHTNPHFSIVKQDMVRPDGTEGTYYILARRSPFSIIIPITEKNETFIVGQYRVAGGVLSWEFPMGGVDGKKPLEIAKQELKEEVGLTATKWKDLGYFYVANGHTPQKGYVFLAKDLTQGKAEPEPGEFFEIKKVPIKQIGKMIKSEEIVDGPTISAYQLFTLKVKQ